MHGPMKQEYVKAAQGLELLQKTFSKSGGQGAAGGTTLILCFAVCADVLQKTPS